MQIELAHLAIAVLLTGRGYRLESFENVLGPALDGEYEPATLTGIVARRSGDDEFDRWLDAAGAWRASRPACARRGSRASRTRGRAMS